MTRCTVVRRAAFRGVDGELTRSREAGLSQAVGFGVVVVSEISLIGWFASALRNGDAEVVYLGVGGIMVLGLAIVVLDYMLARCIERIRVCSMDLVLGIIIAALAVLFLACTSPRAGSRLEVERQHRRQGGAHVVFQRAERP